jgi:hypothetical protein
MVCPSATSKAEARWLRFGLVVVATTSRRDDKNQMIRPYELRSRVKSLLNLGLTWVEKGTLILGNLR